MDRGGFARKSPKMQVFLQNKRDFHRWEVTFFHIL